MRPLDLERYSSSQREGVETFDTNEALIINEARLKHLESLDLSLEGKKVLDVGCGVGHLAQFFVERKCDVVSIDGREENLQALRQKYPTLKHELVDIEREDIETLGTFDIVFCYGLLYHTENPALVIEKMAHSCTEILLLETCVTDYDEPLVRYVEETGTASQALHGMGSRPTSAWVVSLLRHHGFAHIYSPLNSPAHKDFLFPQKNDFRYQRDGHNLRRIFIASKHRVLTQSLLVEIGNPSKKTLLQRIAEWVYRPRPLGPIPTWYVGMLENEKKINWYRQRLQQLWLKLMDLPESEIIIRWYGTKLMLNTHTELSRTLYIEGTYEPNEFYFLSRILKPGMHFVDIGANNGLFSLFATSYIWPNGCSYAIEPSPREITKLTQNVRLNTLPPSSVKILEFALSDLPGERELLVAEDKYDGHNTLGHFIYDTNEKERTSVKAETLDRLVQKGDIKKVDVMKIDAEGSEYAILRGSTVSIKKFRPIILIEICDQTLQHQHATSSEIFNFMKNLEYTWYIFDEQTGLPVPYETTRNTPCKNFIAIPQETELEKLLV